MRTRTLLLLAVACGFVILAAGVAQLLRIAGSDDDEAPLSAVGEVVEVGDLTVVVDGYRENDAEMVVGVTLGGVDDEDGAAEFRLVVPEASLRADDEAADACAATRVSAQSCQLVFDLADAPGGSRVLLYRRGDEVARWELADP